MHEKWKAVRMESIKELYHIVVFQSNDLKGSIHIYLYDVDVRLCGKLGKVGLNGWHEAHDCF